MSLDMPLCIGARISQLRPLGVAKGATNMMYIDIGKFGRFYVPRLLSRD